MANGKIGVTTENIFPVIKQFLYSDHEIFLREIVSNAVDATQKLKALSNSSKVSGELGDLSVRLELDEASKTLKIIDRGIGMTAEEIEKYINQIAFSGAEEFLEKYKDQAIIGHFGLGFYSSFMVSDKVEIISKSYQEGSKTVHWSCTGTPEYEMEEIDAEHDRGTEIILHISEDCKEYAVKDKLLELLNKYCKFLPVPIVFGKEQEWKDGKYVDTDKDKVINNVAPLWTKTPSEIKDEEYNSFYETLYPMSEAPLFNIHLNIDYPFNLTGILYFPKISNNIEIQKNKIQLYCNQVFVTDQVNGIVPEYLTLLHGVIDSPDIPLNVSRSYLQSDSNVKKISGYITKKVADRLTEIFNTARENYETKWDDLKIFIQYGVLTDEKFAEKAPKFTLWKNTEGKFFTLDEYKEVIKDNQTDKDGNVVVLYVDDPVEKNSFVEAAKAKGYDVLELNGQLDNHFIQHTESKNEKLKFVRVDSDIVSKLIQKEEEKKVELSDDDKDILTPVFESRVTGDEKKSYQVQFTAMDKDDAPIVITQDEWSRRMKEMSKMSGDMYSRFYGSMPDRYILNVNTSHPLFEEILSEIKTQYGDKLGADQEAIKAAKHEEEKFEKATKDKKEADLSEDEKSMRTELSEKVVKARDTFNQNLKALGEKNELVHQVVDLALLSNGLLKGKALTEFINRSISLIGKK